MLKKILIITSLTSSLVTCGQNNSVPESLFDVKSIVAQLDSAVTSLYGWEPRDSTYNHTLDTLVAGIMNDYNADDPEYKNQDGSIPAIQQQAYDEARNTWAVFKRLIDDGKYKEALDFYEGENASSRGKNSGDFLVFLKHSTHRYVFFSEVLRPLMQEYRGDDYAREEFINLLHLEKALEDASIQMQADNTSYVPEVYPRVVKDLGIALAESGKMDEAHDLFYDLIDGVYGLTGSTLLANFMASDYAEKLYLIDGDKEGAIANWNRFKEAIEQNKSDFDPEEYEVCLRRILEAIEELTKE